MLDIDMFINSIKCSWIKRIFDKENTGVLKSFYLDILDRHGGKLILKSNLDNKTIKRLFPKQLFLQQIITSWTKIKLISENSSIGKEIIWHNKNIKLENNSIFYQDWYDKGIQNLEHIYMTIVKRIFITSKTSVNYTIFTSLNFSNITNY